MSSLRKCGHFICIVIACIQKSRVCLFFQVAYQKLQKSNQNQNKTKKELRIMSEVKPEGQDVCRSCTQPMLQGQERKLMKSKEGNYEIHHKCYLETVMDMAKMYRNRIKRKSPTGESFVRRIGRPRWPDH